MSEPREFWIYPYKTTRMLFTYLTPQPYKQEAPENFDEIRVIEYKEYEKLKKQNEILTEALNKILNKEYLKNTIILTSYPPQNAAVCDIQNIAKEALDKVREL